MTADYCRKRHSLKTSLAWSENDVRRLAGVLTRRRTVTPELLTMLTERKDERAGHRRQLADHLGECATCGGAGA